MKKISTTTAKKFRKMQKLTFGFRTEVANQVAAPAETRTPSMHRANDSLLESADGSMATVATRQGEQMLFHETRKEST